MRIALWAGWLVSFLCLISTQTQAADAASEPVLEAVVVSGVQPGPGLWRVSKDDHVLWILGTLSPLPRKMRWDSRAITEIVAESQEVLLAPSVTLGGKIGFFRGLTLLPSLLRIRKNPDGEKLANLLPAELYARWRLLKQRYLGWELGIETRRPIFAAEALYQKALQQSGLSTRNIVVPLVTRTAERHTVTITQPWIQIQTVELNTAIKAFKASQMDDIACFRKTIERIETDLEAMKLRANAWATGDLEAIAALPYEDQESECFKAVLTSSVAASFQLDTLSERLARAWLEAADTALQKNRVSFAALPLATMLKSGGYLALLEAKGYLVESPY